MPWNYYVCVVSGYTKMKLLGSPTYTFPTMGWSILNRSWSWSAPVKWTSTSFPSTHRDATSPLVLHCIVVREGVRTCVCVSDCPWLFMSLRLPCNFLHLLSPQLKKFGSFLSPIKLGPHSFPESWWRLGVPPADCLQHQFYLQQQTVGTTYLHCTKST